MQMINDGGSATTPAKQPKLIMDIFEGVVRYADSETLSALAFVASPLSDIVKREKLWRKKRVPFSQMAFLPLFSLRFPTPKGIQINMMPIDLSMPLPEEYNGYSGIVTMCAGQMSGTAYLTIDEREVPVGEAHRRPGLHCESPAVRDKEHPLAYLGKTDGEPLKFKPFFVRWGRGVVDLTTRTRQGGIYFGSNIAASSRIYPNVVLDASMVGNDGALGNIRHLLGPPSDLASQALYWMTDRTPHESMPLKGNPGEKEYRQFFRLVVGPIGVWYSKHNTPSPLGVKPNCPISDVDKFDDGRQDVAQASNSMEKLNIRRSEIPEESRQSDRTVLPEWQPIFY
ncbi:hypothetical protein M427DRAFT_56776 [Gonapodya prolifera JEL478]|uniref:Uncharacterized protein n=1 Tax=Gonapodya prolifera (strain JEL478) TaxID=1344416 RepID=A0A139AFT1_GONPJ|nr:hypothetical protein M427DRAFT_56776 [Gonapodya prolifera JEL478]|eukprot:KXS15424.1 hypothetical protein M427DRAFT_56776 [Gonapodya prolifera JEL478]